MTTKQQLAEEIKALQDELDAMPEVLGINYKPKMGEIYFVILSNGDIDSSKWVNNKFDKARYARGNCYPTREAAERIDRNRQTLVKLREFAFVPDFFKLTQEKYHFYMCCGVLCDFYKVTSDSESPVYFETDKLRYDAREAVGEAAIVDMLQGGLV